MLVSLEPSVYVLEMVVELAGTFSRAVVAVSLLKVEFGGKILLKVSI